ncbi:MAG: peroxiredoxin [Micromonosporaceae bacterium]
MSANSSFDPASLPPDLPEPVDDGAAAHLRGMAIPPIALSSTEGGAYRLDRVPAGYGRLILYAYPKTGRPGVALPAGWDEIPGARGCTPESCGFRDHAAELARAGAAVAGVSTQDTEYQKEAAKRLRLPFPLLSDSDGRLVEALKLPAFTVDGETLLKRLTLVIRAAPDGGATIEHVFYPVFPPGEHAAQVLAWLGGAA